MLQYNISNITLFLVVGFLLATLMLGLYAGRGIKDIKDYALGGKSFSTFTLTLTLLATYIGGGSTIGTVGEIYSLGIIITIAYLGIIIQHLVFAFIISPKIVHFKNCLTLGDLMKQLYGKNMQIITGVLTSCYSLFSTAIQFFLIGKLLGYFLEINTVYGIIIGGSVLSIYSALGGIKAVTITDIFQFIVLFITIPFIATLLLKNIGGYKELLVQIPKEKFFVFENKKFYYYLTFFASYALFPRALTNPAIMQRVFMAKNKEILKNKFLVASIIDPVFRIVITIIGLSAIVLYPHISIKKNEIFPYLINNFLKGDIMKGFAISGLLAVIMSSADSFIHSAGLVFTHDILSPVLSYNKKKIDELVLSKLCTILIGILSIILAIKSNQGLNFRNINLWTVKSTGPILFFPLLAGIIGIKTNKKSLIYGILAGIIGIASSEYYLPSTMKMLGIPIGILANALVYMISHIIQNKGIAWVKREETKEGDEKKKKIKLWIPEPIKILQKLINYIPTPKKIYNYSRFQVMKNGSENIIFGIYCCVNFTLPYFLWDHQDPDKYNLMTNLRFIGGIMAGLLIVKDEWKKFLKPYYPLYWHATLTYCLPFITTVMFLLSGGSLLWLIHVTISIFFLIMLVAGELFLILAPLGILLGLVFYKYFVGPINILSLGFDINYYLIYAFFFPTVIGLLFAYKKKIFNKETSNIGINLGLSLCHEIRNTLSALSYTDMAKRKMERIEEMSSLETRDGEKVLIIKENSFKSVYNDVDIALGLNQDSVKVLSAFENLFIEYKKSNISLQIDSVEEIVRDTLSDLHFLPGQLENIHLDLRDDFFIQLPKAQFVFVLSNIIRNAFKHGSPSKVEIKSENNKLVIRDNGKGIPESDIERIFQMHYTTGKKGDSSGIGLWFSKIIINSFNGEITCDSQQGENSYTEFIIKFPEIDPSKITEEDKKRINIKKSKRLKQINKLEIVKTMIEKGESINKIIERTGLSSSEIKDIQKKIEK